MQTPDVGRRMPDTGRQTPADDRRMLDGGPQPRQLPPTPDDRHETDAATVHTRADEGGDAGFDATRSNVCPCLGRGGGRRAAPRCRPPPPPVGGHQPPWQRLAARQTFRWQTPALGNFGTLYWVSLADMADVSLADA